MKSIYLAILVMLFAACGEKKVEETLPVDSKPKVDYSSLDKFLGEWYAEDLTSEVIKIRKINNFDSAAVCIVDDGLTQMPFPYNVKEDKFRMHQPDYWVELLYDENTKELHWKVIGFDETDGRVVRMYKKK